MALNILTVVPMSDKPERQLSDTGMVVTDSTAASMSIRSWTRKGVIDWTKAGLKALTMNIGSTVTNTIYVTINHQGTTLHEGPIDQFSKCHQGKRLEGFMLL